MLKVSLESAIVASVLFAGTAEAQDGRVDRAPASGDQTATTGANSLPESAESGRTGLNEIVVTAQKRGENLQNVPIAITAITADQLTKVGITSPMELTFATPGLYLSQTTIHAEPFIRGIGSDVSSPGNEPAVAMYIDGIYIANMNATTFGLTNIDRVEVLKGPQGTLYGRNSTGGLINIITSTPTDEFQFNSSLTYGSFERVAGQAYISGALAPGLKADLAVDIIEQGKGYYRNIANGERVAKDEGKYFRSKIVADLGSNATLKLAGDYSDFTNSLAVLRQPKIGTIPNMVPGTYSFVPGEYAANVPDDNRRKVWGVSATATVDFGAVRAVSISAYRKSKGKQFLDGDDSSQDLTAIDVSEFDRQFTQEVQILSSNDSRLEWIIGAFYLNADASFDPVAVFTNGVFDPSRSASLFSGTESLAGFAQLTYEITSGGKLTLGGRYSYDKKDYRRSYAPGGDVSESWREPTWRVAYAHEVNLDTLVYASYNRGYKSGTYNALFGPPIPVDPEIVDTFELGTKAELFDRRLRLNVAGYYSDYRGIQVRTQLPGNSSNLLQNAASARIYGMDLDMSAALTSELRADVGFSWIHARYTDFPFAGIYVPRATGGNDFVSADAAGDPLPRTPEFSGNVTLSYNRLLANDSEIDASVNLYATDEVYWAPGARLKNDPYVVLNATIGYTLPGGQWSINVFGRNLTDAKYPAYLIPSANTDRIAYAIPRTFGVKLGFEY